jgi:hypothetical protein
MEISRRWFGALEEAPTGDETDAKRERVERAKKKAT